MKAVIYARYSCDHQREESIDGQLRECKEFAQKQEYLIVGSYIDRAMSAKTDNRPQFQQMIKDSAKGGFDIIIVWKLDRFARNRYDSAHYKSILRRNGVKVVSATEVISEGAEGIILESVLEGYAEYYSAELSEKVIRGLTENALKCQYNGRPVPVGYVIDETKHYQLDPTTAPFVKDAFEMYASGKMVKDIYEYLNSKGVKTSYGKPMNKTNTTAILRNTKYRGQYCCRDIKIENGVPRIVSDELFEAVQRRLNKNQISRSRFKAKHEYFLSSKMVCSDCGALDIMKEQLHDEILTRDQVVLWLKTLKTLDLTNDDNKRILVDTFINSIIVYDNKLAVSFNFRDGAGDIPLLRVGCSDGYGLGAPS